MVGPRVVGAGEKVRGECVVAAAKEALRELESTADARRSTSTGVMAGRWDA